MFVDANVSLSRWPFRRLAGDETPALVKKLRAVGVTSAWAGSFDGLLHRDIAAVNARLAAECRQSGDGFLVPFGTVNPTLPDWEDDVRRCQETHQMPGLRLHPNYHGYTLDDPRFAQLLELASRRKLLVQLVLSMEDERTQHPLHRVPHVDPKPLLALLPKLPELRLMVLNGFRSLRPEGAVALAHAGQVSFDIAMLEGVAGLAKLTQLIAPDRIVFGSNAPLFYWESAALKLTESGLPVPVLDQIKRGLSLR